MLVHHTNVIMGARASQITSLTIVFATVNSDADQRKHQSSTSLAFAQGIHRGHSPHKWPVTRKMFPLDDVIMLVDLRDISNMWVLNPKTPSGAYIRQWTELSLARAMACYLFGAKPLNEPTHFQQGPCGQISMRFESVVPEFSGNNATLNVIHIVCNQCICYI